MITGVRATRGLIQTAHVEELRQIGTVATCNEMLRKTRTGWENYSPGAISGPLNSLI